MKRAAVKWGLLLLILGRAVWGQEASEPVLEALRAELHAAQEALLAQQRVIEDLERRLAELEARSKRPDDLGHATATDGSLAKTTWKAGTTTLTFPQAQIRLSNRLQARWIRTQGGDSLLGNESAFRIRRAKTQLQGWAYTPDLTFLLQVDWTNAGTIQGSLDDAAVAYDFTHGKGLFQVRAGQFKTPFGRQSLASTRTSMFVERSFVTYEFCSIRDVGIEVYGKVGPPSRPDLLEYAAGLFNGEGRGRYDNPDGRYQKNLRVVLSPWGSAGYDEAALEEAPGFRVSLGAAYEENDHRVDRKGSTPEGSRYRSREYDLLARWGRFSGYGEYFRRSAWASGAQAVKSDGLNLQVGLLLLPARWEVFAGRWTFDPAKHLSQDRRVEWGLGTNLYLAGFSNKLQADWRRIRNEKTNAKNLEFRLQYQIVF